MKPKILIAVALLTAFLAGGLVGGYLKTEPSSAFNSPEELTRNQPVAGSEIQKKVVTRSTVVKREASPTVVRPRPRSWKYGALIIGGSAAAGSAIGAIAGGGKGAAIGAVSGGSAGLVCHLLTRRKNR